MTEIPFLKPPESSAMMYGVTLDEAQKNYAEGKLANGVINHVPGSWYVASKPSFEGLATRQDIIIPPFQMRAEGGFQDRVKPEDEIGISSTFEEIRSRFSKEAYLSEHEARIFFRRSGEWAMSGIGRSGVINSDAAAFTIGYLNDRSLFNLAITMDAGSGDGHVISRDGMRARGLHIDPARISHQADEISRMMGIGTADARMIATTHWFAHEQGHLAMGTAANELNMGTVKSDALHEAYLTEHPERGFIGVLSSDVDIHDERFAEGLAVVAITELMQHMGYDQDAISRLVNMHVSTLRDSEDLNPNSHLGYVEQAHMTGVAIGKIALALSGITERKYEGALGYGSPLSPEDIAHELLFVHQNLEKNGNNRVALAVGSADEYRAAHSAAHSGSIHSELKRRKDAAEAQIVS